MSIYTITVDGIESTRENNSAGYMDTALYIRPMIQFIEDQKYMCHDYDPNTDTCLCYDRMDAEIESFRWRTGREVVRARNWSELKNIPDEELLTNEQLRKCL